MLEPQVRMRGFSDELFFTLAYTGGIRSAVNIVPLSGHDRSFNLDVGAEREDRHKLLIQISPPSDLPPPIQVEITNLSDLPTVVGSPAASEPSGRAAPSARVSPPAAQRSPTRDSRDNALRDLEFQQSLKIQQRIQDALPPR